jgi:hypothetical protein
MHIEKKRVFVKMHVMKILYMASIYELITEIKIINLKKQIIFTAVFMKKPLQK